MARLVQLLGSLAFGGTLLWLSFRDVDARQAWRALGATPWWTFAIYLVLLSWTHMLRSERFRLQLSRMTGQRVAVSEALAIFSIGVAATFLVPFRLGEFVRPYLTKVRGHLSGSAGLSTVAAERVIDGLTTTAMLGVVLLLLDRARVPAIVYVGGYMALAVFGGATLVFVIGYRHRALAVMIPRRVLGLVSARLADKGAGILDRFIEGLNTLPSWRDLVFYELHTVAYWVMNGASMYLLMLAMGIDPGWIGAYFVLSCLVIGVMIPAPPGNVGNFEYAVILPLTALGTPPDLAAAYAIVLHVLQSAQMVLMALIFLGTGKVTFRRVVEATQRGALSD